MTDKGLGMACVVEDGRLLGIITDGDLRRHLVNSADLSERSADEIMTRNPVTVSKTTLAAEVLNILEQRKITSVVVVSDQRRFEGVVQLHDLWRTEMF
jgi:arabinose-5-phosphate isomerase